MVFTVPYVKGVMMKLTILQIKNRIVTCQLDNGTVIDIARRWFTEDIQKGDVIELGILSEDKDKDIE